MTPDQASALGFVLILIALSAALWLTCWAVVRLVQSGRAWYAWHASRRAPGPRYDGELTAAEAEAEVRLIGEWKP